LNFARSPPAPAAARSAPHAFTSTAACAAACTGLRPPSAPGIAEIHDTLTARIAEAEREGWHGEAEGLKISLAGARDKLAQIDRRSRPADPVNVGMPAFASEVLHAGGQK